MLVSKRDQFELTGRPPTEERSDADRIVESIEKLAKALAESRPEIQVAAPNVSVAAPDVNVAAPNVTVQAPQEERKVHEWDVSIKYNGAGKMSGFRFKPVL